MRAAALRTRSKSQPDISVSRLRNAPATSTPDMPTLTSSGALAMLSMCSAAFRCVPCASPVPAGNAVSSEYSVTCVIGRDSFIAK